MSRPRSSTGDGRTIRLTRSVLVEYTVSRGRPLVFDGEVFDVEVSDGKVSDGKDIPVTDAQRPRSPGAPFRRKRQDNDRHPVTSLIYARRR